MDQSLQNVPKAMKEFSIQEVGSWVSKNIDECLGGKFEEHKVDGGGPIILATKGSQEQLLACGLKTVGDQVRLRKLIEEQLPAQYSAVESSPPVVQKSRKPSGKEIHSDLHRRIYNAKKKAVRAATIRKWPGNSIPNFKKSSASLLELSALADELAEECSYPPVGFLKPQIRQHILDILNERRRSVRKGHDYTSADKRTLKKKKIAVNCDEEGGDTDLVTCTSNGESSSNDPTFAESSESKQGVPAAEG